MEDLKMLFHIGYYDYPLCGLAEYNGEKVYFNENLYPMRYKFSDDRLPAKVKTVVNELLNDDFTNHDDDDGLDLGDYSIYYMGKNDIHIERKLQYNIYQLPEDVGEKYFQQMIEMEAWHQWHPPEYYRSYTEKSPEYFTKWENKDYVKINLNECKLIGSFPYDKFKYFDRPK